MHYKKGFSLVSFLVYLALFSMVTLCMCHAITVLIIPSFSSLRKTQSIIALHIATDVFVRDIKSTQNGKYTWNVMLPQELIWQKDDYNIGWCFYQNRLERREGMYKGGNWQAVKTSIVAKGLSNAVFTPIKDNNGIVGVELTLTPHGAAKKPVACYVSLKGVEV
jgi:type II secretory pathway component PulJ